MNEITLSPFGPEHFNEVLAVLNESNRLHADNNPDQFLPAPPQSLIPYLNSILEKPENFGFVALSEGRVAGIVLAGKLSRDENIYRNRRYIQIYDLAVSEKFKKRGIGTLLINRVVEEAKSDDIRQIELEVFSFNCNAVNFYEKNGFREVSRIMTLQF